MKNAILVSSNSHWRTVIEATLLSRGWHTASVDALVPGQYPDPKDVQTLLIDAGSISKESIAAWIQSAPAGAKVPVVVSPSLQEAETLADVLDSSPDNGPVSSKAKIRFWGVRGSIPTPGPSTSFYGGNTSCVELAADGETIILDAGTGIRVLGEKLIQEANGAPLNLHLLITHTHWDHIQGLPFFRPAYMPTNRIRVVGYCAVRHGLADILATQMEDDYFPISMADMPGHPEVEEVEDHFQCGPVKVEAFFTNHPGRCAGFRFETSAGVVVYVSDNELNHHGQATHLPRETVQHMHDRFVNTLQGCDVLIHDAQYTRDEYEKRIGWGHSAVEDVVELAHDAKVKRLVLFHHDPMRDDASLNSVLVMARAHAASLGGDLRVDLAREGLEIRL